MHAITIVARNYLPFAAVLAESFRAHNPGCEFVTLVVDALPGEIDDASATTFLTPRDLNLDPEEFGRMALLYDVTELSTSLKPWALELLLDRGAEVALYLDPDVCVYSPLDEVAELSAEHGVVLTPHTTSPMPRDGKRPNEADIMAAGVYNLGFIAVNSHSRSMLDWWKERLLRDSLSDQTRMLFTDQRWVDLVPGYFPHTILADSGYNVAYWNLDQRELHIDEDGAFHVNGRPLRFFHFSGYRPEKPWILSRHTPQDARIVLSEQPALRELCDRYGERVLKAGIESAATVPYRFGELRDKVQVTPAIRRVYRAAVLAADRAATQYPPAAFGPDYNERLIDWLMEPAEPTTRVSRALYGVWQMRPDLQAMFPNPLVSDELGLLLWGANSAVSDGWLPAELAPNELEVTLAHPTEIPIRPGPGVNVAGYFQAELGVGQIGRLLVDAVRASGLPYSTWRTTATVNRQLAGFDDASEQALYPVTIASVNADQFGIWDRDGGRLLREGRYTIGVWAWEVEEFPDAYCPAFNLVDEVWAISTFCRDAIAAKTDKPVHVLPYQITEPPVTKPLERAAYRIGDGGYFLYVFDYQSIHVRKNPLAVVEAFTRAFDMSDGVQLVLKSINGERSLPEREQLRHACAGRPDIILIEEYMAASAVRALMAEATAYVSLHRSEGYGLTMAEAMALGKPVVATGYGGNLDFMDEDNSLLVPYELVPIGEGAGPYPANARWADPDIAVAATHLRWIIDEPGEAAALGRRAQTSVLRSAHVERTARFISDRVTQALARQPEVVGVAPPRPDDKLAAAAQLIGAPPDLSTPSRFPVLAHAFRRSVYRALAHHDEQIAQRLEAIVSAAQEVNRTAQERLGQIETVERAVEEQERHQRLLHERLADQARTVRQTARAAATNRHLIDVINARVDSGLARVDASEARMTEIVRRLDDSATQLRALHLELAARPYQSDPEALLVTGPDGRRTLGFEPDSAVGTGYASFEDLFRGEASFIAKRMHPYVDALRGHEPVLDIGCGRGELLQLLAGEGIAARGVDIDAGMVERSLSAGLDVTAQDGLQALREAEAHSLGAVTAIEVIEHLQPDELVALTREAARVLKPGGVLLLETVNPHSPAALKAFWLDLTHVRPIYPEALLFLVRDCGFDSGRVLFLDDGDDLDTNLRERGEYAVLAYKSRPR
jgi:glycosyltransferase involved in cell wall biosynthesis/SAM-dependent methyltransferase